MGATVSTFQEHSGDPASELTGMMYRSGEITRAQLMEMLGNLKGGLSVTDTGIALGQGGGGSPGVGQGGIPRS